MKNDPTPLDELIQVIADELFCIRGVRGELVTGDRLALMKRDGAGREHSLGGRNRTSVESVLREALTPLFGTDPLFGADDPGAKSVDAAIQLGKRLCAEYNAQGKHGLAQYYLKRVTILEIQKLEANASKRNPRR